MATVYDEVAREYAIQCAIELKARGVSTDKIADRLGITSKMLNERITRYKERNGGDLMDRCAEHLSDLIREHTRLKA